MSILFIRLPSRATLDSGVAAAMPDCLFALTSEQGNVEREGREQLSGLAELIASAGRVVLLLAAADVTLLRLPVPPLSAAKLKVALPHLVEDQLITDAADCVIVAGKRSKESPDNLSTIAVAQRDWLELLVTTLRALGARHLQALPAQLCLQVSDSEATAAITDHGVDIDVVLRFSTHTGLGWSVWPELAQVAPQDVIGSLRMIVSQQPLTLYVPANSMTAYRDYCHANACTDVTLKVDGWSHWVGAARDISRSGVMDLMTGLTASAAGTEFSWRRWRWPLVLAATVLLVNIVSLNVDWWRMRREATALRSGMIQGYRTVYPNETVIDPIAQIKQKIVSAEYANGRLAPDDFLALAARFGGVWTTLQQNSEQSSIASLEYRDHQLLVRLKNAADADAFGAQIKSALEANHLSLSQPTAGVWQIGGHK